MTTPPTDTLPRLTEKRPTTEEAIAVLLEKSGITATGNIRQAVESPMLHPKAVWAGLTRDTTSKEYRTVPGAFWIPAVLGSSSLRRGLQEYRQRKGISHDDAVDRMVDLHAGIGNAQVSQHPFAYVEIDHLSRMEQEARYAALTAATGLQWAMQVYTGGKSVHAYLRLSTPLDAGDPLWREIQEWLICILVGDTKIVNASRLMRLPGWHGDDRHQPITHWDPDAGYAAGEILDKLITYAESMGITDRTSTLMVLRTAEQLAAKAKHATDPDDEKDLLDLASTLRATRSGPSESDVELAMTMLGRRSTRVTRGDGSTSWMVDSESHTLSPSQVAYYAGMGEGSRCDAPCCSGRNAGDAEVYSTSPVWVYCWRCDATWTPAVVEPDLTGVMMLGEPAEAPREFESLHPDEQLIAIMGDEPPVDDEDALDLVHPSSVLSEASSIMEVLSGKLQYVELGSIRNNNIIEPSSTYVENPPGNCKRGVDYYRLQESSVNVSRLSCRQHDCPACGPRMVAALSAAGQAVLSRMYEGWSGVGFGVSVDDPSRSKAKIAKSLHRWINPRASTPINDVAAAHRGWLSISPTPEVTVYLMMWDGDEHAPSRRLRTSLGISDPEQTDIVEMWGAMCRSIELDRWAAAPGLRDAKSKKEKLHEHLVGGERGARGDICWVRDALMGRVRRGIEDDPDYTGTKPEKTKTKKKDAERCKRLSAPSDLKPKTRGFRTSMPRQSVFAKIEEKAQDTLVQVGDAVLDKRKSRTTRKIALQASPEQTGAVVRMLHDRGEFDPHRKVPAPETRDLGDGLLEITDFGS